MRHGRAVIPFGKYKGCRLRLLPDSYLSFLTGLKLMRDPKWGWLMQSVIAELKWRGLRYDLAVTPDPIPEAPVIELRPKRQIDV